MPTKKIERCEWCLNDPLYIRYHDEEWGVPVTDDQKLFEFLILEGAQAGLSWFTILKKRENYRKAFANFNPQKVARFDAKKIQSLLEDAGIVRNRLKIESAVSNAQAFLKVQKQFGSFANYQWELLKNSPLQNKLRSIKELKPRTELSDLFSKNLKELGFRFVGSTIIYAHMQAVGMVNDHRVGCFRHAEVKKLGRDFQL